MYVLYKPLAALLLSTVITAGLVAPTASAQYPSGTGSAAHDMDDEAAALLLHIQQNYTTLTSLTTVATTLGTEADSFHDFIHDVENNKNGRMLSETACEYHRLLRAFFAVVGEVNANWSTLSGDSTFVTLWNKAVGAGASVTTLLLSMNPRQVYLYFKVTESLTHKMDDEAAALLLYLQQNHPTETTAIALATTFANTADAYHDYAHDVGKCMKTFASMKAEYLQFQNDMFTLGNELVAKNLIPNDAGLWTIAVGLVNYYVQHTQGMAVSGIL